jgi:hypothetical protein
MANIRKTFNFRNGVQVDDDNLIVNPLGLVGIGTSVPTEALDVRGNLKVVGFITATNITTNSISVGVITASSVVATAFSGGKVSIISGIVTATSGVVTYYGDGGGLSNLPTSQWIDTDVGLGFTSIYAQGFVGVSTNDPRYTFQVGGTNNLGTFASGVGIDSTGNIRATGIITASKFVGIGSDLTLLNASNISSGTIGTDRIPTLRTNQLPSNITVSGIITATGGFIGTVRGDLYGNAIGIFTGPLVGTASTADSITPTANITVQSIRSDRSSTGIGTVTSTLDVFGSIGIGTSSHRSNLHIVNSGISSIQLTSTETYITLGRSLNRNETGSIRFGNTNGLYPYSTASSLDIINYYSGNINSYLNLGTAGLSTGNFNWIYGQDPTNTLLTLTYQGNLGIGVVTPTNKLDVNGNTSISGNLTVLQNISSLQNVSVGQSLTVGDLYVSGTSNINLTNTVSVGDNINAVSGISTFNGVRLNTLYSSGRIGILTSIPASYIHVGSNNDCVVISENSIGIGTTNTRSGLGIDAVKTIASFGGVTIGSTDFTCFADFSNIGGENIYSLYPGLVPGEYNFLRLPNVTQSTRDIITTNNLFKNGGVVFNTTNGNFEGYNGSNWISLGISGTPNISVGILTATGINVGTGVTINSTSGIVTSVNGFSSGIGTAVKITTVGNRLYFTVAGVGSTSFVLY